ncbi:MAG: translocation/assembly module TamB [Muribaculaceae bacterium]|nr:translocation/assembly module TamB [Muribaculaceae bacterium]
MSLLKPLYKVFRSIVMTLIVLLVVVYLGLYVVLSVPHFQEKIKDRLCSVVSELLGGKIEIGTMSVHPFTEVILSDVTLDSPQGERCATIGKVAAGIDLWTLFSDRKIVLNYAEIIDLNVDVVQASETSPLNIQFLIDALSPDNKSKPSAIFDIRIRNIVVRNSRASLSRPWMKDDSGAEHRLAYIDISRLRMDLSIPVLRNDLYRFDVRNIQFDATPGISVRSLSTHVTFIKDTSGNGNDRLMVEDCKIRLPNSLLTIGDVNLSLGVISPLNAVVSGSLTPADLSAFIPALEVFDSPWDLNIDASLTENTIIVSDMQLDEDYSHSSVNLRGDLSHYQKKDSLNFTLSELNVELSPVMIGKALSIFPGIKEENKAMLESLGRISLELEGNLKSGEVADAKGILSTDIGNLEFSASCKEIYSTRPWLILVADADKIHLDRLLKTDKIEKVSGSLEAEIRGFDISSEGHLRFVSDECVVMGNYIRGIELDLNKDKNDVDLKFDVLSEEMTVSLEGWAQLAGSDTRIDAELSVDSFNPSDFGIKSKMADCDISAHLKTSIKGNNADNVTGKLDISDVRIKRADSRQLNLSKLNLTVDSLHNEALRDVLNSDGTMIRDIRLICDWLDARVTGRFQPSQIAKDMKDMIGSVFPTLVSPSSSFTERHGGENDFTFDINIKGVSAPYVFFDTPVRPLIDIPIRGSIDAAHGKAALAVATPHLQQGKNKLIRDVSIMLDFDAYLGMAKVNAGLIFPAKKGDAELLADIYAVHDKVNLNLGINPTMESLVKGTVLLSASFSRIPDPFSHKGQLAVNVDILPSSIMVNDKSWVISDGGIDYSGKRISISNFLVSHEDQFVKIDGTASESADDAVYVRLNDIDLEYIFNLLNINYVSFGGMATGEVVGSRLLTKRPEARTEFLRVKALSYNGAVIGDGDLASEYDAEAKKVGIYAVVRDPLTRERRASIDGGIWVTRDSLSFGFDVRKINVGVMKPFVSAFCSDLYGEASGKCKLFGTFSDIDLVGDLKADTLSMKLDFTNTWYHAGNDSVFLHEGVIEIPPLTLYDDEAHTAEFSGWLRHRYFHDPVFNFRLRDAKSLLCYNTNEKLNPLWYGTIYGSGHAQINGYPGMIDIDMNMTTEEGSKFYYVISDAEDVAQYSFLTFTDKRKQRLESTTVDSVPEYLMKFRKETEDMQTGSSNVILSLKGTVTNDALVTLVMDPRAGDNITARGQGALQMDYNLASNDLRIIGTYVLDEGNYNFTLQDIIIKNFNIRKGSLIKFDGDPMKAILDIAATYRVNTNLTDLDKSFSTDKELNRTNVPVDAVLLVDGPMTNPDITFDIQLPSLTSDVERKVKSIVSTNDMMSRQIIYLLALNRFYTPEYTGGQSNGSEWSSMASSTISSQLSNILSQMTDKLDVAPSFRSEKGDFSDMEFDLALSSRLLNNRLLINGNFGYRDRSTSNTQFVGDFDIEYLLSKNGNLRLKAYNHFNDQNYYLRSALTTQGVGVVFRRDFDRLFRKKKKEDDRSSRDDRQAVENTPLSGDTVRLERDSATFNKP